MKKSLIYLIALCLSYTAMQAVCKYAEEQREDRGGGGVPIAALIRLGMGYGISYANAPGVGEQTYIGRPPFGGCH
ncbi:hypothetical protein ACW734_001273 [Campylobacter coli]|nr:hypothetical protein [Campylobacter coli]EDO7218260.1 hypothetical protein [Campylobacter coli]EDO7298799.1 hypothetical protein [Campylobacter coli]